MFRAEVHNAGSAQTANMKSIYQILKALVLRAHSCGAAGLPASAPVPLPVSDTKPDPIVPVAGSVTLREPDDPRGQYKHGFRVDNDSAAELQNFDGLH